MNSRNHLSGGAFPCCCGSGGGGGGGGTALERIVESRADALTGVEGMTFWHEPFVVAPGTRGSYWRDVHATDTGIVNNAPGGVLQVFANAGYGVIIVDPHDGYPGIVSGGPSIAGAISADEPFYMFTRFRLLSAPGGGGPGGWQEGQCAFVIGLVDPTTLGVVGVGIALDAESHFGAVGGHVSNAVSTTGIPSTVARDFDTWHTIELFTEGGKFWLKVDDGTALDVSALFPGTLVHGTPFVEVIANDVTQPAIDIDHISFAAGRNGAVLLPLGPPAGGVASITAVSPLVSSGGANPQISIPTLTAIGANLLAAADEAAARTAIGAQHHLVPLDQIAAALSPLGLLLAGSIDELDARTFIGAQQHLVPLDQIAAALSPVGLLLAGSVDELAAQQIINVEPGVDVQAYDAELAAIAGLTGAADRVPYFTGPGAAALATFSAAGRAMAGAADEAAQRLILSLEDVGDLRAYAIGRAKTLLGLTGNPTVVIDDPCLPTAGRIFTGTGGAGTTGYRTDRSGGWIQISTTATAMRDRNIVNAEMNTAGGVGCIVPDVGGSKWYQLWLFSLDTAVDAACFLEMGWINTAFSVAQPKFGLLGSAGTAKFRAFDNTTGVDSSVNVDTGIHVAEHWCDALGNIYFAVDGESSKTYATAKTAAVMPICQVYNGATAANRALSVGHLIVITP